MVRKYAVLVLIAAVLFFIAKTAIAMPAELKNFLDEHNNTVKIYIELKNSSGDNKVNISLLKKLLEESFTNRKSYAFVIANTADEADMVLKCDIKEYKWLEVDPVDEVWGIGAAAMDAAISDNYAAMQVETQIVDARHNRVIWNDKVQASVTQHIMPKDSSYELVYPRFVQSLGKELFRKSQS